MYVGAAKFAFSRQNALLSRLKDYFKPDNPPLVSKTCVSSAFCAVKLAVRVNIGKMCVQSSAVQMQRSAVQGINTALLSFEFKSRGSYLASSRIQLYHALQINRGESQIALN